MVQKSNYKIEFKQNDSSVIIADNISSLEESVTFALNLHKASNSPHRIYVVHDDFIDITFVLPGVDSE